MNIAIAQAFFVVLYVGLTYAHARSQAFSDAKDHKAEYPMTGGLTTGVEMGFLMLLIGSILMALHMGWQTIFIMPMGFMLWRATYGLTYDGEMGLTTDLSDVSAEVVMAVLCLGLLAL